MKARILIVEDEDPLRRVLELQLGSAGYETLSAATAEAALPLLDRADLVLTDLRLPGIDGLEFIRQIRCRDQRIPIIVITAYSTVENAVEAMKAGAADFLPKPFSMDHLLTVIAKALEVRRLRDENLELRAQLSRRYAFDNIIGRSPAMQEIFATIERVAPTNATVLIAGESGTGKDLIARAIHHHSPRRDQPFVKINCAAIPETLLESELFGYEKGAFTGATTSKPGKFELADKGTVFLDEIGDVPPAIQVKLLRVLQDKEFERLGSNKVRRVDVRIIAATNADLRSAIESGQFREDLYYRLNVVPINVPPLRQRKEDIPALVDHFIKKYAAEFGRPVAGISDEALEILMKHHWPGNVRELENVIERAVVLCTGERLEAKDIKLDPATRPQAANDFFLPEGMTLEEHERQLILKALERAKGNKSLAARMLGITRNALRYRLSQMGLE